MPVVRCEIHNIPYNSANPRGCPACWREQQGESSDAEVMKQLARLSMGLPAIEELPPEPRRSGPRSAGPLPPGHPDDNMHPGRPPGYAGPWPPPVTTQPRLPAPGLSDAQKAWRWAVKHRSVALAVLALVIVIPLIWIITRPNFVADPQPPIITTTPRPLAVLPNVPIDAAFGMLGTERPVVNPDTRALARYQWPDGVIVDALNGMVYAVTLTRGQRSWRGLQVGTPEEAARGEMALLGPLDEPPRGAPRRAILLEGYQVVPTLDDRPIRGLTAEIRPPNGCLDVQVTFTPRTIGRLRQDPNDLWALARGATPFEWVVGSIRLVSRTVPGPYAGRPDCAPPTVSIPVPPQTEFTP